MQRFVLAAIGVALAVACSSYDEDASTTPAPAPSDAGHDDSASDAAADTNPDVSSESDAGVAAEFSVACGNNQKCASGEVCCFTYPTSYACAKRGAPCPMQGSSVWDCDDDRDCAAAGAPAGTVCCGSTKNSNPTWLDRTVCTAPTNCEVNSADYRLCDPLRTDQCGGRACLRFTAVGTVPVASPFDACQK